MQISCIALACTASLTSARALRHGTEYIASVRFITTPRIAPKRPIHRTQPLLERERIACEFARTVPAISDVSQIIICPQKGIVCKAPVKAEASRLAANYNAQSRRRSRRSD